MKNEQIVRMVWKLKENIMRARFQERVKKLVEVNIPNIWNAFKNDILKTCDEVIWKEEKKKESW